jgi:hypothetical protein
MTAFFNGMRGGVNLSQVLSLDSLDDIYGSLQEYIQRYVVELKAKFLNFVEKLISV